MNQEIAVLENREEDREVAASAQYLTFFLQKEMFGLDIRPIREICEYGKVTPIPMVPDYVRGVMNLRGNVVPVIDLPVRFGWPTSPVSKRTCIVIVEVETEEDAMEIGIVIDSVSEVLEIPREHICPPPAFGAQIRTDFIGAMGRFEDAFVVLLNVEKVLSVEELAQLDQATGLQ